MSAPGRAIELTQLCQNISGALTTLVSEMAWSKENIIAILALIATCAPILILAVTLLLRQRRLRCASKHCTFPVDNYARGANVNSGDRCRASPSLAKPIALNSAWSPPAAQGIRIFRACCRARGRVSLRSSSMERKCFVFLANPALILILLDDTMHRW
jgi:hypothetical protein